MVCVKTASWMIWLIVCTIEMKEGICWLFRVEANTKSHLNYYYAIIDIGTPSQPLSLLIDTSCSHTYLNPPDPYHPTNYEYEFNKSSTSSWLTCNGTEHCNVCLNSLQCGWQFACEQMYVMAKDIINLNNNGNDDNGNDDNENYLIFGYNVDEEENKKKSKSKSKIFSVNDAKNNDFIMSGILSLNRKPTSFSQQMYNKRKINKIFAHYFNRDAGSIAFGDDVENLLNNHNIGNEDISWIQFADNIESSMYQIHLYEITLSSNLEPKYDNEYIIFNNNNRRRNKKTKNDNSNLNILTLDTGITGIQMNHKWKESFINYIINVSHVELIRSTHYDYCIDATNTDDILEDILYKLPNINIELSSQVIYIISPQQYIININNNSIGYPLFCLDISFDEDYGICLGSQSMENYIILYDDNNEQIGIYDTNRNHKQNNNNNIEENNDEFDMNLSEILSKDEEYIYILSLSLVGMLICSLLIFIICIFISRKMSKKSNNNIEYYDYNMPIKWNGRRDSVTIDAKLSPQHIDIKKSNKKQLELDSNNNSNINSNASSDISISISSSVSPLQSYYDGNVKSIVYDRIIRPWNLQDEMDAV